MHMPVCGIKRLDVCDRDVSLKRLAGHQDVASALPQRIDKEAGFLFHLLRRAVREHSLGVNPAVESDFSRILFPKRVHLKALHLLERLQHIHAAGDEFRDQRSHRSAGMLLIEGAMAVGEAHQLFRVFLKEFPPHIHAEKKGNLRP